MYNGIFDLAPFDTMRINQVPLMDLVRVPFVVNLSVLGVLVVAMLRQERVRAGLIGLNVILLLVFMGVPFTAGVLGWCAVVYVAARALGLWAKRLGSARYPLLVGWVVVHLMYVPCAALVLPPFHGRMGWGELALFWGIAILTLKSLHYIGQVCRSRLDPSAGGSFGRLLSYMIHVPSFRLGPYQTYEQFTGEVDTCKQRISLRNMGLGLFRILLGFAKYLFLFHEVTRHYLVPRGYSFPFMPEFFNSTDGSPMSLWTTGYVMVIAIYLGLSGYSDGAIGMNRMMGIRVPENFRWACLATDVIDFWRRWHCSLRTWLIDEIYIPIGRARGHWLACAAVFAYCGLWHYPLLWTVLLFPVLQVTAFYLTYVWKRFWTRKRMEGDPLYAWARRLRLVDSIPSKMVG